ncbi:MAG: hypothetical protein IJE43_01795 [Alphaproteobacteria bacterium]|nr:hypothetical protein [Alphaproteobacteria bacterium]
MRTIQIFLGGGVKLLHGENEFLKGYRNDVIDPLVSQLNSCEYVKHFYVAKDFTDLTRNVVPGKHQDIYNTYIVREAQIALFIIDGEIGNITKHEIDVAVASTKNSRHPIVFIYGKNINEGDEILEYLNQEGIYFQHFFDNRDLSTKIKADLESATRTIDRRRSLRFGVSLLLSLLLCGGIIPMFKTCYHQEESIIDSCTAQLYLMRYKDVNALTGKDIFTDSLLSVFKYEDSIMAGTDISVFPIINADTLITTPPPFFRLKLYNKHRNTIVFVEGKLEVDNYVADTTRRKSSFVPMENVLGVDMIKVDKNKNEYNLKKFRQNVAYGETDDRYFFCISSDKDCRFRMRVRAKSQLGDYLYSNYIYVNYKQ